MNEFYQENAVTIWIVAFVVEISMGLLAQAIAERKGHTKRWFWAGFLLSLLGVVWAAGLPDETLRRQMRQIHGKQADAPEHASSAAVSGSAGDDPELVAVLAAAVAAFGAGQGRRFIMRSFRPVGAASTAWSRAGRY